MAFFDELKQPAPRREEPVLTPEEAAEAEVLRRLADPEVQRVAAEMARTIRSASRPGTGGNGGSTGW